MADERLQKLFRLGRREVESPEQRLYADGVIALRAWHALAGKSRDVIDFDLTQPSPLVIGFEDAIKGSANSEEKSAMVKRLQDLYLRAQSYTPRGSGQAHNFEFFLRQIEASTYFARRLNGEKIAPAEYIEKTTGVKFERIPDEVIEPLRRDVMAMAADPELGMPEPTEQTVLGFKYDRQLPPEEAHAALETRTNRTLLAIRRFIRNDFAVPYRISDENENAFWTAWSGTDPENPGNFLLRQNFNSGQQRVWTQGIAEMLGSHEPEHLARMAKRKTLLGPNKLHDFFGLTTVHGPESVVEEGLAQTLVFFVSVPNPQDRKNPTSLFDTLSKEGKFWVNVQILKNMVYANVHVMVNDPAGYDEQKVIDYIKSNVPWESDEDIKQQIEWRTKNPLNQIYLFAYGKGAERFLHYAKVLNEAGKRMLLQYIYSRPYTPEQVENLFLAISRNPSNRAIASEDSTTAQHASPDMIGA